MVIRSGPCYQNLSQNRCIHIYHTKKCFSKKIKNMSEANKNTFRCDKCVYTSKKKTMISTKYLDWKLNPREDPDAGAVRRGVRYAESGPAGRGFPTLV